MGLDMDFDKLAEEAKSTFADPTDEKLIARAENAWKL
jgi:hypothetical protein